MADDGGRKDHVGEGGYKWAGRMEERLGAVQRGVVDTEPNIVASMDCAWLSIHRDPEKGERMPWVKVELVLSMQLAVPSSAT
jgi:hypothetical protein